MLSCDSVAWRLSSVASMLAGYAMDKNPRFDSQTLSQGLAARASEEKLIASCLTA